jgi:hypothetical protein
MLGKMGALLYSGSTIEFDDRALFHLQIVISAKLRRHEGFTLSWFEAPNTGHGRSTIWLSPSSTLHYQFSGSRIPILNSEWVRQLMASANSAGGLMFTAETNSLRQVRTSDFH